MSTSKRAARRSIKVISAQHSPDHDLFAYAVDEQGSEIYTVYVKDLASGEHAGELHAKLHRRFLLVAGFAPTSSGHSAMTMAALRKSIAARRAAAKTRLCTTSRMTASS